MLSNQHNSNQNNSNQLYEGLELGDLARVVHPKLHIDEFKSKMGDDADIIVLSFKVGGKEPANDLMNFIERGYDWVLDADVSAGELDDGEYLVFVELERNAKAVKYIFKLLEDIMRLTEQNMSNWKFQYNKDHSEHEITEKNLIKSVPLTPGIYDEKYGDALDDELDAMKESARVPMRKKAPVNEWTDRIRVAAGLK